MNNSTQIPPSSDSRPARLPTSRQASTALFLGMVALVSSFVLIGGIIGIVAIGLGTRAIRNIEPHQGKIRGKPMAIAGIALGSIALIVALVALGVYTSHRPHQG